MNRIPTGSELDGLRAPLGLAELGSFQWRFHTGERWIDVTWDIDEDNPQRFPAKIAVTAMNESEKGACRATRPRRN